MTVLFSLTTTTILINLLLIAIMEFNTNNTNEYWAQFDRDIEYITAMCASNASNNYLAY